MDKDLSCPKQGGDIRTSSGVVLYAALGIDLLPVNWGVSLPEHLS